MNELHESMHVSGRAAGTLGDLNSPLRLEPDQERATGLVEVWREYESTSRERDGTAALTASPREVGKWFVLLDSLPFVFFYTAGLALFLGRARKRFDRWLDPADPDDAVRMEARAEDITGLNYRKTLSAYRKIAYVGIVAVVLAAIFDELENLTYWRILVVAFPGEGREVDADALAGRIGELWAFSGLKWLFAAAAILTALAVGWVLVTEWWSRKQAGKTRQALDLVALHVGLVVAFGLGLVGHEQLQDLIHSWTPVTLAATSVLVLAFALLVWFVTRRLIAVGTWLPNLTRRQRLLVKGLVLGIVVVAATIQACLHWIMGDSEHRPGWGLLIPAVVLGFLAILGALLPPLRTEEGAWIAPGARGRSVSLKPSEEPISRLLAAAVLVLFGFGLVSASFGYAVFLQDWTSWALAPAVGALTGLALSRGRPAPGANPRFRNLVAAEPLAWAALGMAVGTTVAIHDAGEIAPSVLVVFGLLLAPVGLRLYAALAVARPPARRLRRDLIVAVGVALAVFWGWVVADPWGAADVVGGIGILVAFLSAVAALGTMLIWLNGGLPVPRALAALQLARFPLVSFLVVWFVAASWLDRGGYHDVRVQDDAEQAAAGVTPEDAFGCWLRRNGLPPDLLRTGGCAVGEVADAGLGATPLVFVATTGGGIRAAYWTDLALDCALEHEYDDADFETDKPCAHATRTPTFNRSRTVFAASGVSGGSVGLAAYAAYLAQKATERDGAWIQDRISVDGLSPSAAWWLFVEGPRAFLRYEGPTDRAEVLERAWDDEWEGGELGLGLFDLWRSHAEVPLLLLNGTSVDDGCRFNASVLDANIALADGEAQPNCRSIAPFDEPLTPARPAAGEQTRIDARSALPAARDLADFLSGTDCEKNYDVGLSTAGFLSARFPFVNPSGRIEQLCPRDTDRAAVAYVVDGGYLDTSAASPVIELMVRLEPLIDKWNVAHSTEGRCIVPVMIQIDNGFEDAGRPRPARRPGELTLPLTTVLESRLGRAAEARAGAALLFNQPFGPASQPDRYAHFVNEAHPGPAAPFGWTQSQAAEDELVSQLGRRKNRQALDEVDDWFTRALACA
ncbi:MAG: hypothetical protein WKF41_05735 [Gaiellaceae bacterium]